MESNHEANINISESILNETESIQHTEMEESEQNMNGQFNLILELNETRVLKCDMYTCGATNKQIYTTYIK